MNTSRSSGEFEQIMTGIWVVCGLGCASSLLPWLELLVGQVLAVLAGAALLVLVIRWGARRLREYREDQANIAHVNAVLTARARAEQLPTEDVPVGGDR